MSFLLLFIASVHCLVSSNMSCIGLSHAHEAAMKLLFASLSEFVLSASPSLLTVVQAALTFSAHVAPQLGPM